MLSTICGEQASTEVTPASESCLESLGDDVGLSAWAFIYKEKSLSKKLLRLRILLLLKTSITHIQNSNKIYIQHIEQLVRSNIKLEQTLLKRQIRRNGK